MEDRRSVPRARAFHMGKISGEAESFAENVVVENSSAAGARLKVSDGWRVPDVITLEIPACRELHLCRVRWRLSGAVGVAFLNRPQRVPRHQHEDVSARLIELEGELARTRTENSCLVEQLKAAYAQLTKAHSSLLSGPKARIGAKFIEPLHMSRSAPRARPPAPSVLECLLLSGDSLF